MEKLPGNSPSKYHHQFIYKTPHICNTDFLSSIRSICQDDRIDRLENNQWKCLWCNVIFQGINDTKALAYVIVTKCMNINIFRASIYQYCLSRYKDLQLIKYSKKGLLNYYSPNIISSISRLQDKSSEVVESNIQRNYRGVFSSNLSATSDTTSLRTICSTSPDINQITPQKG